MPWKAGAGIKKINIFKVNIPFAGIFVQAI
jgi:hypothetical protein